MQSDDQMSESAYTESECSEEHSEECSESENSNVEEFSDEDWDSTATARFMLPRWTNEFPIEKDEERPAKRARHVQSDSAQKNGNAGL